MLIHRDPLTKLAVSFLFIAWATLSQDPGRLLGFSLFLAAWLLAIERIPFRTLLRGLLPFLFFAATSSWIYAAAPNPHLGEGTRAGWAAGGLIGSRIMATGLVSMAFALTTDPARLARTLIHRLRMSRRFVYGTLAAIQFLPALAEDARVARLIARGAVEPGQSCNYLRKTLAGLSPGIGLMLLAGAVRRASSAALTMELRGLSGTRPASAWRVPRATGRDGVLAFCAVLIVLILCL